MTNTVKELISKSKLAFGQINSTVGKFDNFNSRRYESFLISFWSHLSPSVFYLFVFCKFDLSLIVITTS